MARQQSMPMPAGANAPAQAEAKPVHGNEVVNDQKLPPVKPGGTYESPDVAPIVKSEPSLQLQQTKVMSEFDKLKASLPEGKIKVIAKQAGLYKNQRRKEGDAFEIETREHLGRWMEPVI